MAKKKSPTVVARPRGLPETARFDPDADEGFRFIEGKLDAKGKPHGPHRTFYDDGTLHRACSFVHGELDGDDEVFHPDGTRAVLQRWKKGVVGDVFLYRAGNASPHQELANVDSAVWEVHDLSPDGIVTSVVRFFDAKGVEILENGMRMPKRPKGVPDDATFLPADDAFDVARGSWIRGSRHRSTGAHIGVHETWTGDGKPSERRVHDDDGNEIEARTWNANGNLKEHTRVEKGKLVEEFFFEDGSPWKKSVYDRDRHLIAETSRDREKTIAWKNGVIERVVDARKNGATLEATRLAGKTYDVVLRRDGRRVAGKIVSGRLTGHWKFYDVSSPKNEPLADDVDLSKVPKRADAIDITNIDAVELALRDALKGSQCRW